MEDLNIKQLTLALRTIAEEKNLPEDTVLEVIEQAIAAAWRRDNGEREQNVRASLNVNDGSATVYVVQDIVDDEEFENPVTQITLEDAKEIKPDVELGGVIEESHEVTSFGRVAAQTAKQVILQRLREAEREVVLAEFEDKIGTVVTGVVQRVQYPWPVRVPARPVDLAKRCEDPRWHRGGRGRNPAAKGQQLHRLHRDRAPHQRRVCGPERHGERPQLATQRPARRQFAVWRQQHWVCRVWLPVQPQLARPCRLRHQLCGAVV